MTSYATSCRNAGVRLDWRTPKRPGKCEYPMIWHEAGPGCPTTCENMMNEVTEFRVAPVSGWFCPGNMVMNNGKCVAPEESANCFCYGFNATTRSTTSSSTTSPIATMSWPKALPKSTALR
ncbi:BMP-binding endothelial regulator protein-like [Branchiostoma lanceolatum]|uniref:BMP-binding endothelial regulator protein-like n=1 Tax=Branchiostoma lanceolatum TaxID=7740 RepID=UPI0034560A6C